MRKTISIILIWALPYLIFAQNEVDALRYSYTTHGGTARYMSMSGAFGALGADFSALSTNPAGIGTFKKSRIVFSPVFMMNTADANYKNTTYSDGNAFTNISNFGLIINLKPYEEDNSAWNSVAFGVGYNKLRNFNSEITIKGDNKTSSILDQFMLNSDGTLSDNLFDPEWLAYDTYLTDYMSDPNPKLLYTHPYLDKYYISQKKTIKTTGGIGEYVFSLGGNYADKFQIGMSFGIQNARYKSITVHSEESDSTDLKSFDYTENLETKGNGYNFKFGMIYRPKEFIRFGLAFHTPTFFKLKDLYSYEMDSHFRTPDNNNNNYDYHSASESDYDSNYEIYTPWRAISSLALVMGRFGIISADYEFVDYGNARMRSEEYDYTDINISIKDKYNAGSNLRLGGEIRVAPVFLRGGVFYYGSPTSTKYNAAGAIQGYSLGIGLQTENVTIDLAFSHSSYDINYKLYEYGDIDGDGKNEFESANIFMVEDMINFTIGFKF